MAVESRRDDEQKQKRKLSYKDARELEQLPARIETLENDIAARTAARPMPPLPPMANTFIKTSLFSFTFTKSRLKKIQLTIA